MRKNVKILCEVQCELYETMWEYANNVKACEKFKSMWIMCVAWMWKIEIVKESKKCENLMCL